MNLFKELLEYRADSDELGICWVGQSGFIFKDHGGRTLAIDLYLTDCGERFRGFKRISPKLLSPTDVAPDYYLITHVHFDHLDYDAIPLISASTKTVFCGPSEVCDALRKMMIPEEKIICVNAGESVVFESIKITAVEAYHGLMVKDSVGYIVEMGDHRVYVTGDTCYREDIFKKVSGTKIDIMIACINGRFGNMDATEAARAAVITKAEIAIPCHYWTFVEHGGNPDEFVKYFDSHEECCKPLLFRHGEIRTICKGNHIR